MSSTKFFFYKISSFEKCTNIKPTIPVKIEKFKPSIFRLKLHSDRLLIYLFWFIITMGKYQIYYIKDNNGTIIHYSHILPKFFKFPFMRKEDIEIGPCWTHQNFRGKNIYPFILTLILKNLSFLDRTFYIMTDENNIPSQKGILKAGFKLFAEGSKKGILGIYYATKFVQDSQ